MLKGRLLLTYVYTNVGVYPLKKAFIYQFSFSESSVDHEYFPLQSFPATVQF